MKFISLIFLTILPALGYSQCNNKAHYNLDGVTTDSSPNNYHGINHGALSTIDRFGQTSSAMAFGGTSQYIDLPSDFDYPQRTINVWFKAESITTTQKAIYDSDHPGMINSSTKVYVWVYNSQPSVVMSMGNSGGAFHYEAINTNQWYMATVVIGTDVKFYLDAQLLATFPLNSGVATSGHSTAVIGCTRLLDRFFDGDIDDLSIYDCPLNQNSIDSLYTLGTPLNICQVAGYSLDANANDYSGNAQHGTNNGATATTDQIGNANSAMAFDGSADYIELPSDFDFPQRTINAWFKAETISASAKVIYDSDHSALINGSTKMYVMESAGQPSLCLSTGSGSTNFYAEPINTNQWYMGTIVVGTDVKYYLNGQLIATFSLHAGSSTSGNNTALIGCGRMFNYFFDGDINDVSIYDCAINTLQIDSLYDNFLPPIPDTTPCIVADYQFSGNVADSSGNILDGTNNGASLTNDRFGNSNSAYSFDGNGDYIELPSDFDTPERSINVWFKAEVATTSPKVIYDSDHPGMLNSSTKMYVWIYGGQTTVCMSTGNAGGAFHNEPINLNQWYMGTIVVGSNVKFYLNSQHIATYNLNPGFSNQGNSTALFGCSRLIDRFFDGTIDDATIYDCVLDQSQIDSLYANFVSAPVITCNASQYYFNGNANDDSGNGNDGITNDVVLTSDLFGNANSAYSFNGTSSYIDLFDDYDFPSRTVNLWFKTNDIDTSIQSIFDSDHSLLNNGSTKIWVRDSAGTMVAFSTGSGATNLHLEPINENQWYMATLVVNPTTVTYYLNGQPVQTDAFNGGSSTSGYDQALLGTTRLFDRYFDGDIDNVSIYQCDMSPSFIDSLFQLGSAAIQPAFCDLEASTVITSPNCFGSSNASINISVTGNLGPISYSWNDGSTGAGLANITAGNYSVFITDTIGCDTTINISINNPDEILILSTVVEPSCNSNEGEIDITVANAASPYDISWSTGDTTSLTDSIPAGLYYVEIIDANGCLGSLAVSLNNSNGMSITDTIVSNTLCPFGNTGAIDITLSGGTSPLNYIWSNGATSQDVTNLSSGLHDVIITDANGCVLSATFDVEAPNPFNFSFTIQPSFCNSSNGAALINVTGGTAPYSYQWITGATTPSLTGLAVGYYSVTVIDDNGCSFTDIAIINEFGGPQIATDTLIQPSCGGNDGQVEISVYAGVPPFDYLWSDNSLSEDLSNVSNGIYSVLVTGSNGCSSIGFFDLEGTTPDSIEICIISVDSLTQRNLIIWEKPVTTDIDHFNVYKETSTANVYNLVGLVDYDSLSVFLDSTANPQVRGWRYKLTGVDLCGNESMQSQFHKTLHLNANLGVGGVVNLDWDEYTGFPYGTFYIWRYHPSTNWIIIDSIPSNLFAYTDISVPVGNLDYYIEVRKSSGCNPTRSGEISSRSNTKTQNSIGNSMEENQNALLNIYPNPTLDLLLVQLSTGKVNAKYEIMDVTGKLVDAGTLSNQPINVKELSKGLYTINVILENENYIQKFIKN